MHKNVKKGLAGILAVGMVMAALTGCSKKEEGFDNSKTMLSLKDGESIDAGTANLYMRYSQAQFENGIGAFIKSYYGEDVNLWEADLYGDGEAYGNTFKTEVLEELEKMLLAKKHAADYSVEVTDEQKTAISAAADQFLAENDAEVLEKMSATKETVENMLTMYTVRTGVENGIKATVDTEVSDEEAAQRTVRYAQFYAETEAAEEETEAETEMLSESADMESVAESVETAVETAVEAETDVKTGSSDVEEAVEESATEAVTEAAEPETEELDPAVAAARVIAEDKANAFLATVQSSDRPFEELAQEAADADPRTATSTYTFGDDDTYPAAPIIEATKGLEDGTLVDHVVQNGNYFYVLYVEDAFDEEATEKKKVEIVDERKNAAVTETFDGWLEEDQENFTLDSELWTSLIFDMALAYETEAVTETVTEAAEETSEGAVESVAEKVTE